ncbi:MAG: pyruvate, water dikinase [Desulfosarcina sp.]|nr:pyruvate, water dikinase [Desulfobacterales bacterium]
MKKFRRILEKIVLRRKAVSTADIAKLRLDFRERYANFKQLISANNKALEIMADIEDTLQGKRPFGMTFVRSCATTVAVNVFQMVEKLQRLAPGKYDALTGRFNVIEKNIEQLLRGQRPVQDERLVIALEDIDKDMVDLTGSKMANLGEIKNNIKLNVPSGFVITSSAYDQFIAHNDLKIEIDRLMQSADLDDIENLYRLHARLNQLIVESGLPRALEDAITDAWQTMEKKHGCGITAAMRSSALGEDEKGSSFAGMHRSELNVSADHVLDAYKQIVASKYSLPAITYRLNKGFKDEDIAMCVGCLVMLKAAAGGVMYSRNPLDLNDDSIVINAAWGLPKAVVDGTVDGDMFVVARDHPLKVIRREIRVKDRKYTCYPLEGVCRVDITEDAVRNQASIDEGQILALAAMAVQLEDHYGSPQDIEWATGHHGEIYLLQCRPLQQMASPEQNPMAGISAREKESVLLAGGITACPGVSVGTLYRVDSGLDILSFPRGAILLAQEANPRWASLLTRAAGVITEHGSFTGHLANVAREFGLPALFGVPGAVKQLRPGDLITLDAGGRAIHAGRIEALLAASPPKPSLMIGSPVHETLEQVSRLVVPLNLLDPDAPAFTPAHCNTFHDITRFVHEKSVHEMFNFGRDHNFTERSSKQLYYHAPMQWWILNLDDGFKEEVGGKYIKLENIESIPMLAFWEGFAAIPWDGPPPVDGKGLMAVMFQSTADPALTPGVRSRYADRNYFMISKNYCNLNSRLGYHFSTLEALVSDRTPENYIGFQFKGGAADDRRRINRIHFIKGLLEENNFRVEVKEDNLIARIEGYELAYMLDRLKILGYLTLHTRQLDMIMTDSRKVNYYRAKIQKDIRKITDQPPDRDPAG